MKDETNITVDYLRCPECGELSPQDEHGWACASCMNAEE